MSGAIPRIPCRPVAGLQLPELGFGAASIGGILEEVSDGQARATVAAAVRAGIRFFDTAPLYGYGRSEHCLGDVLRWLPRAEIVLSTKVGRLLRPRTRPQAADDSWRRPFPFEVVFDYTYDGVMRSFEDSLQRLGMDRVDILLLHDIGAFTHGPARHPELMRTAMQGGLRALEELKRDGRIAAIGLGVNEWQVCREALDHGDFDLFLLAGRYTLLEQEPVETLFPECRRRGVKIVIGGPFNSGLLAGRQFWNYAPAPREVIERARAIGEVCRAHGVPLPAAALRFPLFEPLVASVIPGPRSPEELDQILAWYRTPVPAALWRDLKAAGLLHPAAATGEDEP